ncbi:hypothetical protein SMD22_23445 [Brevibacillus halotolerans]|nr:MULTISPECIES: hypothetical protein [Brevibacillus]MCR8964261.1 hypothetical protein [Brevibacillus laterosporus]MCZ0836416.1 hypothetical protein [Brevibacillus halotolerans]WPS87396.1 hypothetical protein SMD22_23445 [Brevibacillus halotolerans]
MKEGKYVIDNEIEVRSYKEKLEKLNKEREQLKKEAGSGCNEYGFI